MIFRAINWEQVPVDLKEQADYYLELQPSVRGQYPYVNHTVKIQPAVTYEGVFGSEGSTTYSGKLAEGFIPGKLQLISGTTDAADPTPVILTDEGAEIIKYLPDATEGEYVEIEADTEGAFGFKLEVFANQEPGELNEIDATDLSAELDGKVLRIELGVEESVQAEVELGDGERDNEMVVKFRKHGQFGNDYEMNVDRDTSDERPLSAEVDHEEQEIYLYLAVHDSGGKELNESENKIKLVAAVLEELEDEDGEQLLEVSYAEAEEDNSLVAADELSDESFVDGDDGGDLDDAKNTFSAIAGVVNGISGELEFTASVSGGDDAKTATADGLIEKDFLGGLDRGGDPAGTVDRETGEVVDANFGADTVIPVYYSYEKYRYASLGSAVRLAEIEPDKKFVVLGTNGFGWTLNF